MGILCSISSSLPEYSPNKIGVCVCVCVCMCICDDGDGGGSEIVQPREYYFSRWINVQLVIYP